MPARASHEGAAEQAAVAPPTYATHLAPPSERVGVRLKLPLTAGMLFDVRTGAVLWQRQPDRELEIASLTKMMTALLVAEHSRPSDRVLVTSAATHYSGSGVGLLPRGRRKHRVLERAEAEHARDRAVATLARAAQRPVVDGEAARGAGRCEDAEPGHDGEEHTCARS